MGITSSDIDFYYSGGVTNTDPMLSLGGIISNTVIPSGTLENVFENVNNVRGAAGFTDYRCIYLYNSSTSYYWRSGSVSVSQNTLSTDTEITLGLDPAGIGDGANTGVAQTIYSTEVGTAMVTMIEAASTNKCLRATDLGYAGTWINNNISYDVYYDDPFRFDSASVIAPNTTTSTHTMYQTIAKAANAKTVFSAYAKPGTFGTLRMINYKYADFDFDNEVVTPETGAEAGISGEYVEGYYRIWVSVADSGSGTTLQATFQCLDNDGNTSYAGGHYTTHPVAYITAMQFEEGIQYPTSFVPTAAAAATRPAEDLNYLSAGNVVGSGGSMEFYFSMQEPDPTLISADSELLSINDAGTEELTVGVKATTGYVYIDIAHATAGSATKTTTFNAVDGAMHRVLVEWDVAGDVTLTVDGGSSVSHTLGGVAAFTFTKIQCAPTSSTAQLYDIKIYNSASTLLFNALAGNGGVGSLSTNITLNSTSQAPRLQYHASNATTSAWTATVGTDLTTSGTGSDPLGIVKGVGTDDDASAVLFDNVASKHYTGTDYICNTGDTLMVMVYRAGENNASATYPYIFSDNYSAYYPTSANRMLFTDYYNKTRFYVAIHDGTSGTSLYHNVSLNPNEYRVVTVAFDRDEASVYGLTIKINNISDTGTNASAYSGSLSGPALYVGGRPGEEITHYTQVQYIAVYERASWMQGGAAGDTEHTALNNKIVHQVCGTWPTYAAGTYSPQSFARASRACHDDYDPDEQLMTIQRMGYNLPRSGRVYAAGASVPGVTFGTTATLPDMLGPGEGIGIWVKRVVDPGAATLISDIGKLKASGTA